MLVIAKASTTQSHLLLRHLTWQVLYPTSIGRKDFEQQHLVIYCQCLPFRRQGPALPSRTWHRPRCFALISAICSCSPVAHADVKYQLFAECVPPSRSRAPAQGSGHKHSRGHAFNSPLRAGLVRKARGKRKDAHLNMAILWKGGGQSFSVPTLPQGMVPGAICSRGYALYF